MVKIVKLTKEIDEAIHQLIGYGIAEKGLGINELISSMGLTKNEWNTIKEKSWHNIDRKYINEINTIFNEVTK